mmetsp:Transcript_53114/g.156988  ORF Transcript_53114/g.156988 Transcript_53114/m.156988 type:complete len:231 (+) Transcript_53114:341-1033(+)
MFGSRERRDASCCSSSVRRASSVTVPLAPCRLAPPAPCSWNATSRTIASSSTSSAWRKRSSSSSSSSLSFNPGSSSSYSPGHCLRYSLSVMGGSVWPAPSKPPSSSANRSCTPCALSSFLPLLFFRSTSHHLMLVSSSSPPIIAACSHIWAMGLPSSSVSTTHASSTNSQLISHRSVNSPESNTVCGWPLTSSTACSCTEMAAVLPGSAQPIMRRLPITRTPSVGLSICS